ncbi:MAG: hypothetical protein ABI307_15020 [Mycobacterium sp.]
MSYAGNSGGAVVHDADDADDAVGPRALVTPQTAYVLVQDTP